MKNKFFVYILFLFVTTLQAQNSINSFEITDVYDGEMESLLNKNYKDSLQKTTRTSASAFFKKNKTEFGGWYFSSKFLTSATEIIRILYAAYAASICEVIRLRCYKVFLYFL